MVYSGVHAPIVVASAPIFFPPLAVCLLPGVVPASRDLSEVGGDGYIAGTVKVDATPDYPVWRRVRLLNKRDGRLVRETWSDPATGSYRFDYISRALQYVVIAHDHTGLYNAEILDAVTPELMP